MTEAEAGDVTSESTAPDATMTQSSSDTDATTHAASTEAGESGGSDACGLPLEDRVATLQVPVPLDLLNANKGSLLQASDGSYVFGYAANQYDANNYRGYLSGLSFDGTPTWSEVIWGEPQGIFAGDTESSLFLQHDPEGAVLVAQFAICADATTCYRTATISSDGMIGASRDYFYPEWLGGLELNGLVAQTDRYISSYSGDANGGVFYAAHDIESGDVLWSDDPAVSYGTIVTSSVSTIDYHFALEGGDVVKYNSETGGELWRVPGGISSALVAPDGDLLHQTDDDTLTKLSELDGNAEWNYVAESSRMGDCARIFGLAAKSDEVVLVASQCTPPTGVYIQVSAIRLDGSECWTWETGPLQSRGRALFAADDGSVILDLRDTENPSGAPSLMIIR